MGREQVKACVIVMSLLTGMGRADQFLDRAEILQLMKDLTDHPVKTWIDAGILYARHTEYRAPVMSDRNEIERLADKAVEAYRADPRKPEITARLQQMRREAIPFNTLYQLANEHTMTSLVVLRCDGTRFYWEIVVDARTDALTVPDELKGNWYADRFDLRWNQRRVFAWDGEKYTTYFRPGNHAIVTGTPSRVNGPLTAGIIPWGHGAYTYEVLSARPVSGLLIDQDGSRIVHLTITRSDHAEDFMFDVARDHALLSYTRSSARGRIVHTYEDFEGVGDRYCPRRIVIERFAGTAPGRLRARDTWEILGIENGGLVAGSFDVEYDYDALIEDYRFGAAPLRYRYVAPMLPSVRDLDLDRLLRQRLDLLQSADPAGQNCATACLAYVCDKLGVRASAQDLRTLLHGPGRETNMLEMRGFLRERGLHAVAVNATVHELAPLADCQVILHLGSQNHYVVLAGVDDEFVRLIDLDRDCFYYRVPAVRFGTEMKRAALLVSNRPVAVAEGIAMIDPLDLEGIVAAGSCEECNTKIQSASNEGCIEDPRGCTEHIEYFERWVCGEAESGSCTESDMVMKRKENCTLDFGTSECTGEGDWTTTPGSACQ